MGREKRRAGSLVLFGLEGDVHAAGTRFYFANDNSTATT